MNEKIKQIDLSDSSIKQISDFLTSVYDDKKKFNYDYLSWLYRDNPDGEIIGFNAFDKDNNIISHYALLPKLANFQNKNIKIALSINTATSKNAQGFNRSNLANMMGYGDFTPEGQRQSVAQQTAETMGMSMDDLPDAVSKALTKDYSGLMKKLDEKKQEKGGYRP